MTSLLIRKMLGGSFGIGSTKPKPRTKRVESGGFSEMALGGLADLEARIPPPEADARPAWGSKPAGNNKLAHDAAAGGGYLRDADGTRRPHYWGHRERLRNRFLSGGHAPMPDYEMLELLLFNAIPRIDVKPLAKRLLAEFGDLNGVIAASPARISRVEGANDKVYLQLQIAGAFAERMSKSRIMHRNVLGSWDELLTYCRTTMSRREVEQFRILFLDAKNTVLADEEQARGTVDHVPVYPREVVKRALELNASSIILVHNHPSGDPTPSKGDIDMTERLSKSCDAVDISIHDHIIIGRDKNASFREMGLL